MGNSIIILLVLCSLNQIAAQSVLYTTQHYFTSCVSSSTVTCINSQAGCYNQYESVITLPDAGSVYNFCARFSSVVSVTGVICDDGHARGTVCYCSQAYGMYYQQDPNTGVFSCQCLPGWYPLTVNGVTQCVNSVCPSGQTMATDGTCINVPWGNSLETLPCSGSYCSTYTSSANAILPSGAWTYQKQWIPTALRDCYPLDSGAQDIAVIVHPSSGVRAQMMCTVLAGAVTRLHAFVTVGYCRHYQFDMGTGDDTTSVADLCYGHGRRLLYLDITSVTGVTSGNIQYFETNPNPSRSVTVPGIACNCDPDHTAPNCLYTCDGMCALPASTGFTSSICDPTNLGCCGLTPITPGGPLAGIATDGRIYGLDCALAFSNSQCPSPTTPTPTTTSTHAPASSTTTAPITTAIISTTISSLPVTTTTTSHATLVTTAPSSTSSAASIPSSTSTTSSTIPVTTYTPSTTTTMPPSTSSTTTHTTIIYTPIPASGSASSSSLILLIVLPIIVFIGLLSLICAFKYCRSPSMHNDNIIDDSVDESALGL